jgi:hypothetical protein
MILVEVFPHFCYNHYAHIQRNNTPLIYVSQIIMILRNDALRDKLKIAINIPLRAELQCLWMNGNAFGTIWKAFNALRNGSNNLVRVIKLNVDAIGFMGSDLLCSDGPAFE